MHLCNFYTDVTNFFKALIVIMILTKVISLKYVFFVLLLNKLSFVVHKK